MNTPHKNWLDLQATLYKAKWDLLDEIDGEDAAIFDIEANGLNPDKIHCVGIQYYAESGDDCCLYLEDDLEFVIYRMFRKIPALVGHNILRYDLPALYNNTPYDVQFKNSLHDTVYPAKFLAQPSFVFDTLIISQLFYPNLEQVDRESYSQVPPNLIGSHSLKAWGYRLGIHKGDFSETTDWEEYTPEMGEYCIQDVKVTEALLFHFIEKLRSVEFPWKAYVIELEFGKFLNLQEETGINFSREKAEELKGYLDEEIIKVDRELQEAFPPIVSYRKFTPKSNNSKYGYVKGVEMEIEEHEEFNPASSQHIAKRLQDKYSWVPTDLTDKGQPKTSTKILEGLPWPECQLLVRSKQLRKIRGMLSDGDKSWFTYLKPDGRIYGRVNQFGTDTYRCSHSDPNLAQIPKKGDLGQACRDLFQATPGKWRVGADACSLEMMLQAHYLFPYDNGEFAKMIIERGSPHKHNQKILGIGYDQTKTVWYALVYGAGPLKLGSSVDPTLPRAKAIQKGKWVKQTLRSGIKGFGELLDALKRTAENRNGYIKLLDGRAVYCKGEHVQLNYLLQGGGAVLVKLATVLWWKMVMEEGLNAYPNAHIHDETQSEADTKEEAERVGQLFDLAMQRAGEFLKLKVTMHGDWKVGKSWKETH